MRTWIAKRPAASFYLLTLTLSWGYWLTLLALGRRVKPGSAVTHFPGLLRPMLAAMAGDRHQVAGGRRRYGWNGLGSDRGLPMVAPACRLTTQLDPPVDLVKSRAHAIEPGS
jgi:hypothetical protein